MSSQHCAYRFVPAEWEAEHGRPAHLESEWSCPREAVEGTDRCEFHLPAERRSEVGITDAEVAKAFRDDLVGRDAGPTRYVGANFGDVDLSHRVVNRGSNTPIDLRHATVDGDVRAEQTVIQQPVLLSGAVVDGAFDFSDAEFDEDINASHAVFRGDVDLRKVRFRDDCRFADARFEGDVRFALTEFGGEADFYRASFGGRADFTKSTWVGECLFQRASFGETADFYGSRFEEVAEFRAVEFDGTAKFSRSVFRDAVLFIGSAFESEALFKNAEFVGPAHYQNGEFHSEASFIETVFEGKVKFHFAEFSGEAVLSYCAFRNTTYFAHVDFGEYASFHESSFDRLADFRYSTFGDVARFMKATFHDDAFFDRVVYEGDADFRHADFGGTAHFERTTFQASAILADSRIERGEFRDLETAAPSVTLDFTEAHVRAGAFVQQNGETAYYDFRDGRIGDVDIEMSGSERVFDHFYVYRTKFEEFNFSDYRDVLSPDWNLHTFSGSTRSDYEMEANRFSLDPDGDDGEEAAGDDRSADRAGLLERLRRRLSSASEGLLGTANASDLEVTYLNAKNGAEMSGDSQAASRFFMKEMWYRRRAYVDRVLDRSEATGTRLKLLFLATLNAILSLTCGYGEKPRRTLEFSLVVVVGYALLFRITVGTPPFETEFGYLLLSFQSFTSLIFGSTASVPQFFGSFLVATEGFIGAFMIGLFIFALTRSVHR
ncbi:hypothetical protein EXE46_12180 [Halorubrum sp. GN11_10-6_MGM]|uniref:pentapeptide repeat-containing protein n=1 Tax=Halorubrum sp. GN11_10-6_MGM TaxID=2518112 RepID=UPI0010F83739|nr:pentapeptide repeat-containing protein [Halorubrum sp. GN11_10-6_MGM]TKX73849.1 hypothetical protein EXE46_12180 [Halorubrum sp. GN11_10-6_MGM]